METLEMVDKATNNATKNPARREGKVAKIIEKQTSKIPSDAYLWAAFGSIATSLSMKLMKKNDMALFVGQWTAPFLILGVYNKLVKLKGSE